jgi:putative hydrolase of the HAD superfamily
MSDADKTRVKAVWTDFAGVLTPPLRHTMTVFCARIGIDHETLMNAIGAVTRSFGADDMMLPVDTPLITEEEWLRRIAAELPADQRAKLPLPSIADIWFDGREANHAWVEMLRGLRERGYFVGVLSNMMPSWDRHWRRMVPAEELFDDVVLSFAVGHRKPQREIYDLAAERAGVLPGECLFIDDTAENCDGARSAGWSAVHFTGTSEAAAEVEAILRPSAASHLPLPGTRADAVEPEGGEPR